MESSNNVYVSVVVIRVFQLISYFINSRKWKRLSSTMDGRRSLKTYIQRGITGKEINAKTNMYFLWEECFFNL